MVKCIDDNQIMITHVKHVEIQTANMEDALVISMWTIVTIGCGVNAHRIMITNTRGKDFEKPHMSDALVART